MMIKGNLVPSYIRICSLAVAALLTSGGPALAQDAGTKPPEKSVEGATADRVALVNDCSGHKFETTVEIDPVQHRSSHIKLCAKPGATDADWVNTLESAIAQLETRPMPAAARDQVIAQLQAEIAAVTKPGGAPIGAPSGTGVAAFNLGKNMIAGPDLEPQAPFETSTLPSLIAVKAKPGTPGAKTGPVVLPVKPMHATLRCLERGETGKGATCDFFERTTLLSLTAVDGLEQGATIRFLRKGEDQGTVDLPATASGQSRRVPLPSAICRGLSYSKVEILLIHPGETRTAARFGPYGLRC